MKIPAILVDIDGTIALRGTREPYDHDASMEDAVNWPVVKAINAIYYAPSNADWRLILVTGRQEKFREVTAYWLWRHRLFGYGTSMPLLMRITGDQRPDHVVKCEIYEREIAPWYDVQLVFDDRNSVVKMWRELGLICFQVADGDF